MSTAIQSPGGVFVQSPGGVRLAMAQPLEIVDVVPYRLTAGRQCDTALSKTFNDCSDTQITIPPPNYQAIYQSANYGSSITDASQTNPVVLTVSTDPTNQFNRLAIGSEILVDNIVGMVELNGRRFKVEALTSTTITLAGEDGTGHTAYDSGGTVNFNWLNAFGKLDTTAQWYDLGTGVTVDIYNWSAACRTNNRMYDAQDSTGTPYTPRVFFGFRSNFEIIWEGPGHICDTHPGIGSSFLVDLRIFSVV